MHDPDHSTHTPYDTLAPVNVRPFSLRNRLNRALPQHMTDTTLATVPKNFFRLLSPSIVQDLHGSHFPAARMTQENSRMNPRNSAAQSLIFRFLGILTFSRKTAKTATRPNPFPAHVLAHFPRPVCHYMSPWPISDLDVLCQRRPGGPLAFRRPQAAFAGQERAGDEPGRLIRANRLDFGLGGGLRYCEEPIILPFHRELLA